MQEFFFQSDWLFCTQDPRGQEKQAGNQPQAPYDLERWHGCTFPRRWMKARAQRRMRPNQHQVGLECWQLGGARRFDSRTGALRCLGPRPSSAAVRAQSGTGVWAAVRCMGTEIPVAMPVEVDTATAGSWLWLWHRRQGEGPATSTGRTAPPQVQQHRMRVLPAGGHLQRRERLRMAVCHVGEVGPQCGAESCKTAPPFSKRLVRKLSALSRLQGNCSTSRGSAPACTSAQTESFTTEGKPSGEPGLKLEPNAPQAKKKAPDTPDCRKGSGVEELLQLCLHSSRLAQAGIQLALRASRSCVEREQRVAPRAGRKTSVVDLGNKPCIARRFQSAGFFWPELVADVLANWEWDHVPLVRIPSKRPA